MDLGAGTTAGTPVPGTPAAAPGPGLDPTIDGALDQLQKRMRSQEVDPAQARYLVITPSMRSQEIDPGQARYLVITP